MGVANDRRAYLAVLFTDVVGSTELSQRLSPEGADESRGGHFSILRQAVAGAGGTEVKNLGDGLMVVFGSASTALSCAVGCSRASNATTGIRELVGLRVGISGGEVTPRGRRLLRRPGDRGGSLCARCGRGRSSPRMWCG